MNARTYSRSLVAQRIDAEDGAPLRFCLSTETMARDGNVWVQSYRSEDLSEGMPMLWVHDDRAEVIGRWTDLAVVAGPTGRELHGTPVFDESDDNPMAKRVARQVRDGIVRHVSLRIEPGSIEAARNIPQEEWEGDEGLVIGRTVPNGLLEGSFVPVPADRYASARAEPEALGDEVLRALADPDTRAAIVRALVPDVLAAIGGPLPIPEPRDPDAAWWGE